VPAPGSTALIADDHELFRPGLAAIFRSDLGFANVIETGSFDTAMEHLGRNPDIAFASFDLSMPGMDGAVSLQGVREVFPSVQLVVVTGSIRREDILNALAAGVHGYVPKTLRIGEITRALQLVLEGFVFVPPSLPNLPLGPPSATWPIQSAAVKSPGAAVKSSKATDLTTRQREVLRLMAEGKSNKEIAQALDLAEGTVKAHVNALFRTLGVHNRVSAAAAIDQLGPN
jgi:DNA-binding NarL/FixJ family response regulator